jgi:hypothetical protein
MANHTIGSAKLSAISDLLVQIKKQGTPIRIDSDMGTYYVLSADELLTLLQDVSSYEDAEVSFTAQDFDLSEADVAAYETRRAQRRAYVDAEAQQPMSANLEQRLHDLRQHEYRRPLTKEQIDEREQVLHELEAAMLHNLEAAAAKTS